MKTQEFLRELNCIDYYKFCELWSNSGHVHPDYIDQKWESKRRDLANFVMQLDANMFKVFEKEFESRDV